MIVDRSLPASNGKIVIAALYGELTVKRFMQKEGKAYLLPENDQYSPIEVKNDADIHVWGVVTSVIHEVV